MLNRTELQGEYLQLINKLNTANRKKNQDTQISFVIHIEHNGNKSLRCSVNNESFLQIAYSNLHQSWYVDKNFEYQLLGRYILQNNNLNSPNAYLTIADSLRNIFAI